MSNKKEAKTINKKIKKDELVESTSIDKTSAIEREMQYHRDIINAQNAEINEKNAKISQKNKNLKEKDKNISKKKGIITGLTIATSVLALSTLGFGIGFAITDSKAMEYKSELENVYKSNFYSLLDSVNNLETKISKTLNSSTSTFQRKILLEASKNANEAEISVASLPLSQSDIHETIKMVNQISGYTSTLAEKLSSGESLTEAEMNTLEDIEQSVLQLKYQLNEFARKLDKGFSIIDASMDIDSDTNEFTKSFSSMKDNDVEYPTMIYDGPFSDSVVNSKVKGLSGSKVSKTEAMTNLEKYFKNAVKIDYEGETKGRFETYNFRVTNSNDEMLYAQVTQIEGHILTISGAGAEGDSNIDVEVAKKLALEFASENGIEDGEVVWNDTIENDVYLNIAPKSQGIVLYPDLVKVKVNMTSGTIVGYDATSYFTNHTDRTLNKGGISLKTAEEKVSTKYEIVRSRFALAPLDYNKEIVCIEVEAKSGGNTYYFYYNAQSGELENILKVIETDNGNLLM